MQRYKQGATTLMENQDGLEKRPLLETRGRAVAQGVELAVACLFTYALITQLLTRAYSVSREDDRLREMWAVIATVLVYRESDEKSMKAALSRMSATVPSFALCLIYLLILPFHPVGMAALIGISAVILVLVDRAEDVITAGDCALILMPTGLGNRQASRSTRSVKWLLLLSAPLGEIAKSRKGSSVTLEV
jgi:hypothetical protein